MKSKVSPYDLLEERINNIISNIAHQEIENGRRLDSLNHENERIQEILKQSIPREIFDRDNTARDAKIQILTDFKNATEGKGRGTSAFWGYLIAGILTTASIITVVVVLLKYSSK